MAGVKRRVTQVGEKGGTQKGRNRVSKEGWRAVGQTVQSRKKCDARCTVVGGYSGIRNEKKNSL